MEQRKEGDKVSLMLNVLDFDSGRTTPFGKNTLGDNAYRRAERIAAAIHLLTDHISEEEPLRTEVRRLSTDMLSSILELRRGFRSSGGEAIATAQAQISHIVSLLRILTVVGMVSTANAEVLIGGLGDLSALFESQRVSMSEDVSLSKEDLTPRSRMILAARGNMPEKQKFEKDMGVKDNISLSDRRVARTEMSFTKSNGVLMFLKSGDKYGIKDIASQMPEYSEKTIQRMLSELVSRGVVKKEGDKRWSRYSLITQGGQS